MSTISSGVNSTTSSGLGSINSSTQGTISLGTGLISGLPISDLVSKLIAIDAQPRDNLQNQVTTLGNVKTAWQGLQAQLQALETAASSFSLPSTFQAATATSSNPTVLGATAANGAASGSYLFTPVQLATASQLISSGWANSDSTAVGAGTVSIDLGHGQLNPPTALSQLNGGGGVARGQVLVTDRAGHSATIDLTNAQTVTDVIDAINGAGGINVTASAHGDSIVLNDTSAGSGNLSVAEVNNGATAAGLGLLQSVHSSTLAGSDALSVNGSTQLSLLNDATGVRTQTGADLTINLADGSSLQVDLGSVGTLGDVISQINSAQGNNGRIVASIDSTGDGLQLTDSTTGGNSTSVSEVGSGHTAADLGLLGVADSGSGSHVLHGNRLQAGLNSVLLRDLNGQTGVPAGTIHIKDRSGTQGDIDLSAAQSVQDVIDAINNNTAGISVRASLNSAGDGILLADTSGGGANNFQVTDVGGGQTAGKLNLLTNSSASSVTSGNLSLRYVSENSTLSSLGVAAGKFVITTSSNQSATINLTSAGVKTLGDVIGLINTSGLNVTASIDASGTGLLLTDNAGGSSQMKVAESGSTTASDLHILGTASGQQIDGARRITVNVSPADTLNDVATAINQASNKVRATVISDGSAGSPYRLVLSSNQAGTAGQITFDAGATGLNFATLTRAQDALAFLGNPASASAVAIHPTGNTVTGVIPNVTLTLSGTSGSPVQVTVAPSVDTLVSQLQSFTTALNATIGQIDTLTSYNAATSTRSLLLGDATASQIHDKLFSLIAQPVSGMSGSLTSLLQLGFSTTSDGKSISFDASAFRTAYAANPAAVQTLFTHAATGIGARTHTLLDNLANSADGTIQQQENSIDVRTTDMNAQIAQMNTLLDSKQTRMLLQFSAMEQALSTMQSQMSALNSLMNVNGTTSSSATSSNSNSLSSLFGNLSTARTGSS
jgi:flagellar hook-associated protein 2